MLDGRRSLDPCDILRVLLGAVLLTGVLVGSAGASESRAAISNVECAQQITAAWTTTQLANETIAIPVEATNIGALAPAARAGYGGSSVRFERAGVHA